MVSTFIRPEGRRTFAPVVFAVAAISLAAAPAASAGSPYPYCYIDYDGMRSCSFRSLQDCYRIRVGTGMCVTNPYDGSKAR